MYNHGRPRQTFPEITKLQLQQSIETYRVQTVQEQLSFGDNGELLEKGDAGRIITGCRCVPTYRSFGA